MTDFFKDWEASVLSATAVGQRFATSTEEFNAACEHIVRLLTDASHLSWREDYREHRSTWPALP